MKVTIVTISFNQAPFLRACIESVRRQTYAPIEHIIVDPGSTDGSREIARSYGTSVTLIEDPDKGPADGLNKGFARATGDLFGYLNADDLMLSKAVASAVASLQGGTDVVVGHGYIIDDRGNVIRRQRSTEFHELWSAFGGTTVLQQSTFFTRAAFERVGGFNVANRVSWDGELVAAMVRDGARMKVVDEYWSAFRIYPGSITGSGKWKAVYDREHERIFAKAYKAVPRSLHRTATALARLRKLARDPYIPLQRMSDKLLGAPEIDELATLQRFVGMKQ